MSIVVRDDRLVRRAAEQFDRADVAGAPRSTAHRPPRGLGAAALVVAGRGRRGVGGGVDGGCAPLALERPGDGGTAGDGSGPLRRRGLLAHRQARSVPGAGGHHANRRTGRLGPGLCPADHRHRRREPPPRGRGDGRPGRGHRCALVRVPGDGSHVISRLAEGRPPLGAVHPPGPDRRDRRPDRRGVRGHDGASRARLQAGRGHRHRSGQRPGRTSRAGGWATSTRWRRSSRSGRSRARSSRRPRSIRSRSTRSRERCSTVAATCTSPPGSPASTSVAFARCTSATSRFSTLSRWRSPAAQLTAKRALDVFVSLVVAVVVAPLLLIAAVAVQGRRRRAGAVPAASGRA